MAGNTFKLKRMTCAAAAAEAVTKHNNVSRPDIWMCISAYARRHPFGTGSGGLLLRLAAMAIPVVHRA